MSTIPRIKLMNERAILIDLEPLIEEHQLEQLLFYKELLEDHYQGSRVEVINTYTSLLLYFDSPAADLQQESKILMEKLKTPVREKKIGRYVYEIPVCYDADFGLDLQLISQEKNIPVNEIIRLHTQPIYTVYFIGFLPGFLYLGDLDPQLYTSRKKQPRMQVPKGAVGIGEKQTGIYPKASPGGWQLLGNSPVSLFNKDQEPPCEIKAGDRIRFSAVSREEYHEILSGVENGTFKIKNQKWPK